MVNTKGSTGFKLTIKWSFVLHCKVILTLYLHAAAAASSWFSLIQINS